MRRRKAGLDPVASASAPYGDWSFEMQARATAIHRWDLTERSDNPRNECESRWTVECRDGKSDRAPHRGRDREVEFARNGFGDRSARIRRGKIHLDSAGVQAADLVNWYRAFQPDVDDKLTVNQYFTGVMTLSGWPVQVKDAAFSSEGGEAKIPGISAPIRIGAIAGGRNRETLTIEPFRIGYAASDVREDPVTLGGRGGQETRRKRSARSGECRIHA